jgi:hypothetical protein
MSDTAKNPASTRPAPPTSKAKGAVQRLVNALLDELAPTRTLTRTERVPVPIEQHRSPTGCVLQAADRAVSVSWFDDANGPSLGELHVIVWRGTVARRGATRHTKGATIISETILYPIEPPEDGKVWRGVDGTRYDPTGAVGMILSLIHPQSSDT